MKAFFERELSRFKRRGARRAEVRTETERLRRDLEERTKEVTDMTAIIKRQMQLLKHIERTWQPKVALTVEPPPPSPVAIPASKK